MRTSFAIDPTSALMLSQLDVDTTGRVRPRRAGARRRPPGQRSYQARARLLKLLA